MFKKFQTHCLLFFSLLLFGSSLSWSATQEEMLGSVNNTFYNNKFFGFSILFPADWTMSSVEEMKALTQAALKLTIKDDNQHNLKNLIDAMEKDKLYLFNASNKHLPGLNNIIIRGEAQKIVALTPRGTTAEQFLNNATRDISKLSNLKPSFTSSVKKTRLANEDAAEVSLTINVGELVVKEHLYAFIRHGYVITLAVAYMGDDESKTIDQVLSTLKFY